MRKYIIGTIFGGIAMVAGVAYAANPVTFPVNGGSGWGLPGGIQAHTVILGNGTSPYATTSPSTAGFVLTSNGVNADPTFQAATGGGSSFSYPFPNNATTTTITFSNGLVANASTTITQLHMPLSAGGLAINGGLVYSTPTTTFSGGLTYLNGNVTNTGVLTVTGSGNIASSGGQNPNITLTGIVPYANGGTNTSGFTTNQVVYSNGSSLVSASSTAINNSLGFLGIGSSTPGSLLSIGGSGTGINFIDNATSTFSGKGINLLNGGCFAVRGSCIGGVTSIIAGTNITISSSNGDVTINSTASGSSSADPFTHVSVFNQTTSATSTLLALTGSPVSLVASGTSYFTGILNKNFVIATSTTVCPTSGDCQFQTIQSALNAGYTNVLVKNGVYSEQITIQSDKTIITGESQNAIIQCNGSTQSPCISTGTKNQVVLRDLAYREVNAQQVGIGIDFSNSALTRIENVRGTNFATSTYAHDTTNNTFYNSIKDSTFFDPHVCIDLGGTQPNNNSTEANRCRPAQSAKVGFGIYLEDVRGFTSVADDIEGTTTSNNITGIFVSSTTREASFTNPWVESQQRGIVIDTGANRNSFLVSSITSNATDITDNGTNTSFIGTSKTGTLVNQFALPAGFGTTTPTSGFAVSGIANLTTASSTFYGGGINLMSGGCFAIAGTCIGSGNGTVTSVAQTVPSFLSISGSPVTTTGTLAISYSGTALPIANGGTNATSFTTSGNGVYWNGTSLLTAPLTSAVTYPYASTTMISSETASSTNLIVSSANTTASTRFATVLVGGAISSVAFPLSVANGGTGKTLFPANSIITSDAAGTSLIATSSSLYVSNIVATSTTLASIINFRLGVGSTTPGSLLSIGGNGTGTNFFDNSTTTKSGIGGENIAGGCYAISGTCIGSGSSFSNTIANGGTATTTFYDKGVVFYSSTLGTLTQATSTPGFNFDRVTGNLGIGVLSPTAMLTVSKQSSIQTPVSGSTVQFVGQDSNPLRITFDTHNSNSTSGTALMFRNSGGTSASPTATISGAVLGSLNFRGYGTTGYSAGSTALMTAKSEAAFTDTSMPTAITFDTTSLNSVTALERVRITGAGLFGLGTTTPQWLAQFATSSAAATFKGQLALSDTANATSPHWSFRNILGNLFLATSSPTTFATSTYANPYQGYVEFPGEGSCIGCSDIVLPGGINLMSGQYLNATTSAITANVMQDIYTAPAGRRAYVAYTFTSDAAAISITYKMYLKTNGNYIPLIASTSVSSVTTSATLVGIILEPGDSLATLMDTSNTMFLAANIIEYSALTPFRSVRVKGPTNATTTMYTTPSGVSAAMTSLNIEASSGSTFYTYNDSAGTVTRKVFLLRSGQQAADLLNRITAPNNNVSANAFNGIPINPVGSGLLHLSPGDSIAYWFGTNLSATNSLVWFNVFEH